MKPSNNNIKSSSLVLKIALLSVIILVVAITINTLFIRVLNPPYTPTNDDLKRLNQIEILFGDRYEFYFERIHPYLIGKLKEGAAFYKNDDEGILKILKFIDAEKGEERLDTDYVFVVLFDSHETLINMIYYDYELHKFQRLNIERAFDSVFIRFWGSCSRHSLL